MDLIALQRLFYDAVFEKNGASTEKLCKHIRAPQTLTPQAGLAIYRDSVLGKLTRSLKSIYPVCYRLVGETFFNATAHTFIHRYPSLSPDLGSYGQQFPEFLSQFEPAAQLPYLADVARLEWYWHQVFHDQSAHRLNFSALAEIPQEKWGKITFYLPQNSVLLHSAYPIHHIWQINQEDYIGDETVDLDEGEVNILLWRQGFEMRIDLPTPEEWQLLKAFETEERFEIICQALAATAPQLDVSVLLPLLVQRGWIADFAV
ncbi:MAG: DNA-binding domain-containing protein [Pseudomonadota bacterium]|nr:DNA-binding domain-containing protein [Pseudomonadota bacterium]